jgi:S-DNA-T family DNA segregation ATPase FtsK/SpoIIIE
MVIATQRPSVNVITGNIKANFPARIAFRVLASQDSRTILDQTGANQLVGKGDMLITLGTEPTRLQCAFIDTPEIEKITRHIADQQSYPTPYLLPEPESDDTGPGEVDLNNRDELFEEVARLVVMNQQGSTSLVQRKFRIGFNRAGSIMDQLEVANIVGPSEGSKPRKVLYTDLDSLERFLETL